LVQVETNAIPFQQRGRKSEIRERHIKAEELLRNRQKPRSLKRTSRGVTGRKGGALRVSEARHRLGYQEEALHENEERFRRIAERSYDAITATDSEGRFTFVSPSIERIVGCRPEELVGVQFQSFVPESEMPKVVRAFNRMMKGENVEGLQLEVKRKDGSLVHIEVNGSPTLKDGQVLGMQGILRDITERKRAEEGLRESEAKYRTLVEHSLQGILIAQGPPPPRLVFANLAMAKILGYAPDELTALSPKETQGLVHPEDRAVFFGRFSDRLQGKPAPPRYEIRGIRKDGETRWLDFSSNRIEYQGQPAVQATFVDITERKKAEEALRQSEERYRIINQNMSEGVWLMDMNLKPTYISPSVTRARGYTLEELYALPLDKQVTPDSLKLALETLQEVLPEADSKQTDRPLTRTLELEFIRKDGSTFWSENTFTLLMNSNGEPAGILAVSRDITERKRVEEALSQSEERFRGLVEGTAAGVCVIDLTGRLTYLNKAFAGLMGYSDHELVGRSFVDFIQPEDRDKLLKLFLTAAASAREAPEIEFRAIRKDGSLRYLWTRPTRLAVRGETVGFEAIVMDITYRKRIEDALQRSQEKYRGLVENINEIVFSVDGTGLVTYVSPAVERTAGYKAEELIGQPFSRFIHPDDLASLVSKFELVLAGQMEPFEYRVVDKNGDVRFVRTFSSPIMEAGKLAGLTGVMIDMTDRRKMEAELEKYAKHLGELVAERTGALQESERKYRSLVENIPDVTWTTDRSGRTVFISPNVVKVEGYTPEEIYAGGTSQWFERVHPDDLPRTREAFELLFTMGKMYDIEYRVRRKDGNWIWVQERAVSTYERDGVQYADGVYADISERKRADEELRATRQRLEYIVASNPAVIYSGKPFTDLSDWNLTYLSESVVAILGYEPREFVGHAEFWAQVIHPTDRPSVLADIHRLWEKGRFTFEYRMRHKNGTYRWIREEANAVRDANGKPVEVNGYWTDITAQKQAELALSESERKYRQLIEAAQEGLFTYDENAVVTFVNPFLSIMLGYAPEEMVGKSLLTFVDDRDLSRVKVGVERRRRGIADTYEVRLIRKDGSRIYTTATVSPIMDENGKFVGGLALLSDITERKRLEAQLAESQRLAVIGETTAMVGHDLRNPLQAMTGALYLAKKLSRSERVEGRKEAVELLDTIDDQILYMDKIISDLQSYAGPVEAEPVETNLPNLVREVISNAHVPGNVETHVEVQEDLSRVVVDRTLLQRVLANLIINAVQAMPKGGNVTVTAHKEQESVTVSVEDTGEGIARENMGKIFHPFFTTKAKGQGLGLAVCKRLVEAHNGTITVRSEVGKGSTFTLKIPTSRVSGAV
jgi:PAS domain S-box-containing protein